MFTWVVTCLTDTMLKLSTNAGLGARHEGMHLVLDWLVDAAAKRMVSSTEWGVSWQCASMPYTPNDQTWACHKNKMPMDAQCETDVPAH